MNFDVVVIGASAPGLYAAQILARAGKKVVVFERHEEINPARRTLIVTRELCKVIDEVPLPALLHRIGVMAISSPDVTARIRLRDPDPIVERSYLIQWLASRLQDSGGELRLGYRFEDFVESENGLHLRVQGPNGELLVCVKDAVIGADGVFSEVAQSAGIPRPPFVSVLQAEVSLPVGWDPDVTQVWFDSNDTRFFYWLIPESAERGVVGLVGDSGAQARELLRRFLIQHNLKPEVYQGAQVAMHHPGLKPWSKVGETPVYLVGDAAGQVKVTTVGGTVTGLMGAKAAVRAILNRTSYKAELRALKRELDVHWLIRALLDRLDNLGYDSLIGALSSSVRIFLARHNRDSMAPVFWRLPFLEPRLFRVALNSLLGRSVERGKRAKRARAAATEVD
ncbi:MAG: NAD(P)/FAD-dependent oxidoreductase [Acidobacteria bacterium]|nr:NAD(P)/FAD-dependent oxidoreductase [Acidobacteriota bacterium]